MYHQEITNEELHKTPLFAGLENQQLVKIRKGMHLLHLQQGEILFKQNQSAEKFFLVHKGQIKLYRLSGGGDEKVIEIIHAGQTFAEAVMFMQWQSYPVNAEALKSSVILSFDNQLLLQLLRESTETCFRLMANMSMRLHYWLNEIDNLTLQNATYRLVHFLQRQIPTQTQEPVEIILDIPKQVLASRLSIQPETFSRILKNLTHKGLLSVEGKLVKIYAPKQLCEYGADEELTSSFSSSTPPC